MRFPRCCGFGGGAPQVVLNAVGSSTTGPVAVTSTNTAPASESTQQASGAAADNDSEVFGKVSSAAAARYARRDGYGLLEACAIWCSVAAMEM